MKQYYITIYDGEQKKEVLLQVTQLQRATLERMLRRLKVTYLVTTEEVPDPHPRTGQHG